MDKPIVGQKLFRLNVGRAARNVPQILTECTVIKVGRTYFTAVQDQYLDRVDMWDLYSLDNWLEKAEYGATSRMFLSPQHWEDEKEKVVIMDELRKTFYSLGDGMHLPLARLKALKCMFNSIVGTDET